MLSVSKSGEIKLTRGDTAYLTITPTKKVDEEKQPYSIKADDVVTFTVKQDYEDDEPMIEKKITGGDTFHIEPKDTKEFAFGKYVYDVQITTADGDNFTVIDDKPFIITKEVG